ncbi:MAG: helix-turn-helix transcriptional regulator [Bacteroidales bacterium]|nr:helix-turn-helix transcriptional regulator [Bacteroidales bacterium]
MIKKTYPQEYYKKLGSIAGLIREYRINNGYSQMELAGYLNLHRNTLSRAENGKNITLLSLLELADTLGVDLADLFVDFE